MWWWLRQPTSRWWKARERCAAQALESDHWLIVDTCARLIENLPTLTRDPANVLSSL
jgi:hypothetical protein